MRFYKKNSFPKNCLFRNLLWENLAKYRRLVCKTTDSTVKAGLSALLEAAVGGAAVLPPKPILKTKRKVTSRFPQFYDSLQMMFLNKIHQTLTM